MVLGDDVIEGARLGMLLVDGMLLGYLDVDGGILGIPLNDGFEDGRFEDEGSELGGDDRDG